MIFFIILHFLKYFGGRRHGALALKFVPQPSSRGDIRGTQHRFNTNNYFFYGFWVPPIPQNGCLKRNLQSKRQFFVTQRSWAQRPGADLGAIWHRKRSKVAFASILGRFFIDFGWIFDEFRLIFDDVFQDFDAVLI